MNSQAKTYKHDLPFQLELGGILPGIEIAYHTYGNLNAERNNVVWICHALTANSDPAEWWPGLVGAGKLYDPELHFIVCANMLGSCYGTTGSGSINPETGEPWFTRFPQITIRDMVSAHEILKDYLGISEIQTLIGGSMGGQQALEWAIINPGLIKNLIVLATNAKISPWAVAFNHSQRLAIEADATFFHERVNGGAAGLKAARSIALLSYRNGQTYNNTQSEINDCKTRGHRAASYQEYQGQKLVNRFSAHAYYLITEAMDTHNLGRDRKGVENALQQISANTLSIGITSDILFPPEDLKFINQHVKNGQYVEIDSPYGHDGFLIESEQITKVIQQFYESRKYEKAA
jgi:homoserine O-acetyltransferase